MQINGLALMVSQAIPPIWPVWVTLRQFSTREEVQLTVETLDEAKLIRFWISQRIWVEAENSTEVRQLWSDTYDPMSIVLDEIQSRLDLPPIPPLKQTRWPE